MAKTTRTTRKSAGNGRRAATEERVNAITLPRLEDTKNFAKFGFDVPRGTVAPFGAVYVPLQDAEDLASVTVTFNRR